MTESFPAFHRCRSCAAYYRAFLGDCPHQLKSLHWLPLTPARSQTALPASEVLPQAPDPSRLSPLPSQSFCLAPSRRILDTQHLHDGSQDPTSWVFRLVLPDPLMEAVRMLFCLEMLISPWFEVEDKTGRRVYGGIAAVLGDDSVVTGFNLLDICVVSSPKQVDTWSLRCHPDSRSMPTPGRNPTFHSIFKDCGNTYCDSCMYSHNFQTYLILAQDIITGAPLQRLPPPRRKTFHWCSPGPFF